MASRAGVYVRADVDSAFAGFTLDTRGDASHVGPDDEPPSLTFVDLVAHGPAPSESSDRLTSTLQEQAHLLAAADRILIRWPWLAGPGSDGDDELIEAWVSRLKGADGEEAVLSAHTQVGVVQHVVGGDPLVTWSSPTPDEDTRLMLSHARAIEVHALLRRANAIWEPKTYHYRLPNGEHVATFVRFADAMQTPRDAFAISTWLTDRLANGVGIVADTGGVTPLLLQIEAFLERFDWKLGPVAILEAYPSARPIVRRSVESARPEFCDRMLGIQSVSSSGSLRRTVADELDRAAGSFDIDWTLDVIVDRLLTGDACHRLSPSADQREVSWLGLGGGSQAEPSGACNLCRDTERAQFVAIDPRTYGEMTLPEPHRVMPDTTYADAGHLFWERVAEVQGIAIEANPHPMSKVARGKRVALAVRPYFELIARPARLGSIVEERARAPHVAQDIRGLRGTALVVAAPGDLETVAWPEFAGPGETDLGGSVREVLQGLGLDPGVPIVSDAADELAAAVSHLSAGEDVLAFAWGSVTGLTLRRLKIAVADALAGRDGVDIGVNGLVFHSRPSHPREWSAARNQFRPGVLVDLWSSCLPWDSPLVDEQRLFERTGLEPTGLSPNAQAFLVHRDVFLNFHSRFMGEQDDWSPRFLGGEPDPRDVFWGMSEGGRHQQQVRGRSLYGKGLDCLSAYAAIGSVVNYTRLNEQPLAAPRWIMFDLGRLVRSYFDAIIVASVIRWLRPGELWWGADRDDPGANRDSVAYLIDQAADVGEQVILLPELLLACVQGKLPASAHQLVRERALEVSAAWPDEADFDTPRAAIEVGVALLEADG